MCSSTVGWSARVTTSGSCSTTRPIGDSGRANRRLRPLSPPRSTRIQRSPGEIIKAITRTKEFLKEASTLDRRKAGRAALVGAALSAAPKIVDRVKEQKGARYEATKSDEMRQLELMAIIPDWLKAQQKLDKHRGKMTRRERIKTLEPVVAFNKTVREMIDTEQYTTMSQIKRFVGGSPPAPRRSGRT